MPTATDGITVSDYIPEDHEQVIATSRRLTTGVAPWRDHEKIAHELVRFIEDAISAAAEGKGHVLVAKLGGAVVGFMTLGQQQHWTGEMDGYIGELATASGFDGKGVGRALMAAAEERARAMGLERITVHAGAANARARRFYQFVGFAEEDVRLTKVL